MKKVIVLVIAIIVIAGGLWQLQRQNTTNITKTNSNQSENWQTYRNDEYGFKVNYPEDWSVVSITNNSSCFRNKIRQERIQDGIMTALCDSTISVFDSTDNLPGNNDEQGLSLSEFLDNEAYLNTLSEKEEIIINGVSGYRVYPGSISMGLPSSSIYLEYKNKLYVLTNSANEDEKASTKQTVEEAGRIIDSFKFID